MFAISRLAFRVCCCSDSSCACRVARRDGALPASIRVCCCRILCHFCVVTLFLHCFLFARFKQCGTRILTASFIAVIQVRLHVWQGVSSQGAFGQDYRIESDNPEDWEPRQCVSGLQFQVVRRQFLDFFVRVDGPESLASFRCSCCESEAYTSIQISHEFHLPRRFHAQTLEWTRCFQEI